MAAKPTFFELILLIKQTKYRYSVAFSGTQIYREELHYADYGVRENYLFTRKEQEISISKIWNKESDNKINFAIPFAKPHILFLSVLISQTDISRIDDISKWLASNITVPDDYLQELTKARSIYSDPLYKNLILKFIKKADLGFITIFDKLEKITNAHSNLEKELLNTWFEKEIQNFEIYTKHDVYNNDKIVSATEFELLKDESAGSIKYFIIVCLLAYAIRNSCIIWIDELDARFDSSLLELLVTSFHDPEINSINSQLIFTTHNTVLLDKKMRRDQMYYVDKDDKGASKIEKMHSSKKPIRSGKSIEKEYRKGMIGGKSKMLTNPGLFD